MKVLIFSAIFASCFIILFTHFGPDYTRGYNDSIVNNWPISKEQPITPSPTSPSPATQTETSTILLPERKPDVLVVAKNPLSSSSRNPIVLAGRRNYITGDNVTYIIPSDMRRLILNIQENNGRNISSYTLPNAFISVKPTQRIQMEIQ